jgi:hypothetical protein
VNYSEAVAAVSNGLYAWRTSWTAAYIFWRENEIQVNNAGTWSAYSPTEEDEIAHDWDTGDHPPKL